MKIDPHFRFLCNLEKERIVVKDVCAIGDGVIVSYKVFILANCLCAVKKLVTDSCLYNFVTPWL